uniref:armadillo repeat-containing protein 6 isoform X1 n=1 Tax=Ciona intestinalis TaxID=7719 RepID=UPI000180CC2C|nr:armadillo repeat-containing protein 6 isoform X1 [Ciona intestinalis]|eukprot:XP_002125662.1 armadillo repeat-containing protein 6 isoform X1 [Ciona intestinalis]
MCEVKAITQATFDAVVQENIDDFDMEPNEALEDAINQFLSQGISLGMIIKEVGMNAEHEVITLTKSLEKYKSTDLDSTEKDALKKTLLSLTEKFQSDLAKRYQASKIADAHVVLFELCKLNADDLDLLNDCMQTLSALVNGQPDLVSKEATAFFLSIIKDSSNEEIALLVLKILKFSCLKHEQNRVNFVKEDGIAIVLSTAEKFKDRPQVVKEACGVLRSLTLDDDVRVQFGKAHDHTKLIVTEHKGMERLFDFMREHASDPAISSELCLTMSKLMVRSEFCQQLVDMGGLDVILGMIDKHLERQNLVRHCITLIKSISGNDDVKVAVVKSGGAELLIQVLGKHNSNAQICESCLAAITTLSLRNPSHCDVIMAKNTAPLMVQAMKLHSEHAGVQKQACMAIRNLVARTRQHSTAFIENGADELIRKARLLHKEVLEDESKAALRDLEVHVELKERWKGENVGITY